MELFNAKTSDLTPVGAGDDCGPFRNELAGGGHRRMPNERQPG